MPGAAAGSGRSHPAGSPRIPRPVPPGRGLVQSLRAWRCEWCCGSWLSRIDLTRGTDQELPAHSFVGWEPGDEPPAIFSGVKNAGEARGSPPQLHPTGLSPRNTFWFGQAIFPPSASSVAFTLIGVLLRFSCCPSVGWASWFHPTSIEGNAALNHAVPQIRSLRIWAAVSPASNSLRARTSQAAG